MNKKLLLATFVVVGGLFFAGCRPTYPVNNIQNAPIQGYDKKLTQAQVEQAIIKAGAQKGWQMRKVKSGVILATLQVRQHAAVVEIKYSATSYNITYKDSTNLKYDGSNIHQNYNGWIQNLNQAIQSNFLVQ